MQGPTIEELRELSRRSRQTQGVGFLALAAGLVGVVLASMSWDALAYAGLGVAGLAFVAYAHAAGKERGAFRRVFRRMATERKRTLVVQGREKEAMPVVAPRAP